MAFKNNHRTAALLTALLGLAGLVCYVFGERGISLPRYFVFWQEIALGCWLAASILGVAGWSRGKTEEEAETNDEATETTNPEILEADSAAALAAVGETTQVHAYVRKFYDRYGSLFEDLQTLPLPPNDTARAVVLQKLVEMALHAHSFAYYGIMDRLAQLDQSPNARLLLEDCPASRLPHRLFTTDAYQTDAKFRALYEIVKSVPIQELDVLLEDQVYVPPAFFMVKES
ncbi:hypothetical protein [Persicitalea jodogahamensis]|uniref:Uncharacterized protein n=1 Tax=Persicitalea jodogahamensis TaxID=402147 RepID=A0A8J3GCK1_9BACT|nr:hypothetical protein [Persicitalea jodogahamensis]GHB88834.1 hypothetical protein GCM10007390_51170 [Persicitalea jodogahamensis]